MAEKKEKTKAGEWEEQMDLIKNTVAKGSTDMELKMFLHQCKKTGLDPLAHQIYCVKRWNAKTQQNDTTIQTGIDGYRVVADRTGKYAGSDDYRFDNGLTEYEMLQAEKIQPTTATVTVYKMINNVRCPFTATARWDEYYPGDKQGFMWKKMPFLMLGKCAEALALRKAFPQELSGVYVKEEMEQAETGEPKILASPEILTEKITGKKAEPGFYVAIEKTLKEKEYDEITVEQVQKIIANKDLTREEATKLLKDLKSGTFNPVEVEKESDDIPDFQFPNKK